MLPIANTHHPMIFVALSLADLQFLHMVLPGRPLELGKLLIPLQRMSLMRRIWNAVRNPVSFGLIWFSKLKLIQFYQSFY